MLNIKVILLTPLLALILFYITRLRNKTFYRLVLISISALGALFVLFPVIPNELAHLVGVGRGADLVTYLFIVCFFLGGVNLYSKIRKLEANQNELVRKIAIEQARKGPFKS
ncbi:MAG: DUF2304 domain-containing protein [Bacteroidetes bacterium]|nr:DUF2304 domain-containing protein [Bacteroidota bacterium]MBK8657628.1 DUF2304 domain-containing protein [Bacteroidota bacterium]